MLERRLQDWVYKSRRSSTARQALDAFHKDWQNRSIETIQENLRTLPIQDGELDCEALGRSPDEFALDSPMRVAPSTSLAFVATSVMPIALSG